MRFSYKPDISVILPTFNRAAHLENAVNSVITQTFSNWELIVVDDGSSDNSFETMAPFLDSYRNIRYVKHNNRKAALSRNAGMQASFGRYITFLDSDDHYLEHHLASRMAWMADYPDVALLSGGFDCDEQIMVKDCYNLDKLVDIRECILCGTLFGKRELFFALEGFNDLEYAEDTDLWERASTLFSVKKIEHPKSYIYQRAADSITRNY